MRAFAQWQTSNQGYNACACTGERRHRTLLPSLTYLVRCDAGRHQVRSSGAEFRWHFQISTMPRSAVAFRSAIGCQDFCTRSAGVQWALLKHAPNIWRGVSSLREIVFFFRIHFAVLSDFSLCEQAGLPENCTLEVFLCTPGGENIFRVRLIDLKALSWLCKTQCSRRACSDSKWGPSHGRGSGARKLQGQNNARFLIVCAAALHIDAVISKSCHTMIYPNFQSCLIARSASLSRMLLLSKVMCFSYTFLFFESICVLIRYELFAFWA